MTQENKQLLLVDLCGRLPYGVKVWYKYGLWFSERFATAIRLADKKIALSHKFNKEGDWCLIEEAGEILIKPYLRPLSSMSLTEEEVKELYLLLFRVDRLGFPDIYKGQNAIPSLYDWLNAHHFDYRGLIEKGLALEAPKGMYKNEQQ